MIKWLTIILTLLLTLSWAYTVEPGDGGTGPTEDQECESIGENPPEVDKTEKGWVVEQEEGEQPSKDVEVEGETVETGAP